MCVCVFDFLCPLNSLYILSLALSVCVSILAENKMLVPTAHLITQTEEQKHSRRPTHTIMILV